MSKNNKSLRVIEPVSSIPVSAPNLSVLERQYLLDAFDSGWISSRGPYIEAFEGKFREFQKVPYALSVCNGTCALHLALLALGIQPDDEVIVPTLTYVASANAIRYTGATPVFIDSEPDTWNMDVSKLETALTPRTKAILVVHLYGNPCDMDPILAFAKKNGLAVVEDVAEAFGSQYKGQRVGGFGDIGVFSFFGNKTITTGEGGMVTTNQPNLNSKMLHLKSQGMSATNYYYFDIVGYNYRMTNLEAALGLAQLERAEKFITKKRENAQIYSRELGNMKDVTLPVEVSYAYNTYWMYSILIKESSAISRDTVREALQKKGIETRPFFYPCHLLPMYEKNGVSFKIAEDVSRRGLNLPSSTLLSEEEIVHICNTLKSIGLS